MAKILIILLITAFFYIFRLSDVITYDEAYSFYVYSSNPLIALLQYTLPNNHQLHSLMIWLSTSLLGDSIIAIRLPAFFVSMITLSMVYQICKQLYTSNIALLCTMMLALQPLFIQYSVLSRGYMLSALLLLILIYHIYFRNLWGKANAYFIIALCSSLLLTLPTMIVAIIACIFWGMTFHNKRIYRQFITIPAIVGCIVGILFYIQPLLSGAFSEFSQMFGYKSLSAFLEAFSTRYITTSTSAMIMIALVVLALIMYRSHTTHIIKLFIILTVMIGSLLIAQLTITHTTIFPRNLFFILPVAALLIGGIFKYLPDHPVVTFLTLIFFVVNLFALTAPNPTTTDNLIADISIHAKDTDYLVFACCQDGPMRYELEKLDQLHLIDGTKAYERVVIFPFNSSVESLIDRYHLKTSTENCLEVEWNQFTPYICKVTVD